MTTNNPSNTYDISAALWSALLSETRVPELERHLIQNLNYNYMVTYSVCCIKGRWPEAEDCLKQHLYGYNKYLREFPEARELKKEDPVVLGCGQIILSDVPNTITDEQLSKLLKLLKGDIYYVDVDISTRWYYYNEQTIINGTSLTTKDILEMSDNDKSILYQKIGYTVIYRNSDFV